MIYVVSAAPHSNSVEQGSFIWCSCHPSSHNVRLRHFYNATSIAYYPSEANRAEFNLQTSIPSNRIQGCAVISRPPRETISVFRMGSPTIDFLTRAQAIDTVSFASIDKHKADSSSWIRVLLALICLVYTAFTISGKHQHLDNCACNIRRHAQSPFSRSQAS